MQLIFYTSTGYATTELNNSCHFHLWSPSPVSEHCILCSVWGPNVFIWVCRTCKGIWRKFKFNCSKNLQHSI